MEKSRFSKDYIDLNMNLSALGIGISAGKNKPKVTADTALKKLIYEINKRKKRILITIDEVRKTPALVEFIQEFQILIREELPIFLIIAGLYEDIESIENTEGLTFFSKSGKIRNDPAKYNIIREDYKETMGLDYETAEKLAIMTLKGYAFAYQAFGKYM